MATCMYYACFKGRCFRKLNFRIFSTNKEDINANTRTMDVINIETDEL